MYVVVILYCGRHADCDMPILCAGGSFRIRCVQAEHSELKSSKTPHTDASLTADEIVLDEGGERKAVGVPLTTSQLPRTRSMAKLLMQIHEDVSVKTRFKAELQSLRRSNKNQDKRKVAKVGRGSSRIYDGHHLQQQPLAHLSASAIDTKKCPLPEQPVLCSPLHERVLAISKPDIIETTLKATGHHHKCGVRSPIAAAALLRMFPNLAF